VRYMYITYLVDFVRNLSLRIHPEHKKTITRVLFITMIFKQAEEEARIIKKLVPHCLPTVTGLLILYISGCVLYWVKTVQWSFF
jgi:hypothetical protein